MQSIVRGKTTTKPYNTLKILVWLNVATTILHYVDNVIFFHHYPEPTWLNPHLVDAFWFVMTPFAFVGLWLIKKQRLSAGITALVLYCLMSLLVLGHYRFAPFFEISFKIHLFIWLEAIMTVVLLGYLAVMGRRLIPNN